MRPRGITRGNRLMAQVKGSGVPHSFNEAAGYYPRKRGSLVTLPNLPVRFNEAAGYYPRKPRKRAQESMTGRRFNEAAAGGTRAGRAGFNEAAGYYPRKRSRSFCV